MTDAQRVAEEEIKNVLEDKLRALSANFQEELTGLSKEVAEISQTARREEDRKRIEELHKSLEI